MKQLREVAVRHLFTYALLPPPLAALLWVSLAVWVLPRVETPWIRLTVLAAAAVVSYYLLKRFAIGCVLCYKAFAPMELRSACRYTPTCSTYMIMAINKYGLLIGVIKGIRRLIRCQPPYGGEDFP